LPTTTRKENIVDQGTGGLNSVRMITEAFPFLPVKLADGTWGDNHLIPWAEGGSNPVHILHDRKLVLNTQTTLGDIYSNITFGKGLEMRTVFGTSIVNRGDNEYNARRLYRFFRRAKRHGIGSQWAGDLLVAGKLLTYNRRFGKKPLLNRAAGYVMAGNEISLISTLARKTSPPISSSIIIIGGRLSNPVLWLQPQQVCVQLYLEEVNYSYKK